MLIAVVRSRVAYVLLAAFICIALPGLTAATDFAAQVTRIIVPFEPGGGTDVISRTLAQEMAIELGGSVIVENKPGAGTIIGTEYAAKADSGRAHAADGHLRQRGESEPACHAALRSR
jgi:tripartite-type tricarboxylate transporter receptor subunit TctC